MAAIEDDEYRKPRTGMWDYLVTHLSPSQPVNAQSSIYVGDAAGRPAKAQRKKDFNDNDLKFALNVGCEFQTPEQFFLGEKDSWPKIVFNPKDLPTSMIYLDGTIFKGKSGNENIFLCAGDTIWILFFHLPFLVLSLSLRPYGKTFSLLEMQCTGCRQGA